MIGFQKEVCHDDIATNVIWQCKMLSCVWSATNSRCYSTWPIWQCEAVCHVSYAYEHRNLKVKDEEGEQGEGEYGEEETVQKH